MSFPTIHENTSKTVNFAMPGEQSTTPTRPDSNASLSGTRWDHSDMVSARAPPKEFVTKKIFRISGSPVFSSIRTVAGRQQLQDENVRFLFVPWNYAYKVWWGFTVWATVFTTFFETYQIAFRPGGGFGNGTSAIIESCLYGIFVADIFVSFNLAYYNERDEIVYDRKVIAKNYVSSTLWIDLVGVFPFYIVSLLIANKLGEDTHLTQYLALLRLFRMVRLYRVKIFFDILQGSTNVSLMWLTVTRNFSAALVWTHFAACIFFFIARQYDFNADETWIGGELEHRDEFQQYVTSLYWSVVTFTTVGYGDFSPVNPVERVFGMIYMLLNIILHSWIIGSITLLVVKSDERSGVYRETLRALDQYASLHDFGPMLHKRMKTHIKLDFGNREIADEQILKHFPASMRRKVLRKLYLPSLLKTSLMRGVRQQFVDSFLTTCNVEIFSPGEEILQRGSISADLYLLVGGAVELLPFDYSTVGVGEDGVCSEGHSGAVRSGTGEKQVVEAGDFINEIGFFTETPQIETIRTVTACKTLTMSWSAYKLIAQDYPGSAGKILQNLLTKVEAIAEEYGAPPTAFLPKSLDSLRAGSIFDSSAHVDADFQKTIQSVQTETARTAMEDLVKMHIHKQKDDHTTRFLFAATRGDLTTISRMCDQGFDPNSPDYDSRTALMLAAMKGNTEVVTKLLEYQANPNLVDVHQSTALYEAARNGHEAIMEELLKHGADLCMPPSHAASILCQAVFDGDISLLKRLLRAGTQVSTYDYDSRTAVHVAAAEGNVAALKVLVEHGADLTLKDRWGNTVFEEATRAGAGQVIEYLESLKQGKPMEPSPSKNATDQGTQT